MNFIPYGKQVIDEDDIKAVEHALKSTFITTGPTVRKFETAISDICGCRYSIAVSSGTAALHIASLALLNSGDKVLVTPNTFLSTVNSIVYADCEPVFIDIDKEGNIDMEQCISVLKKDMHIRALYGVHFSGNPLNQEKLAYIKNNFDVVVLEDCAHSLGAYEKDVKVGSCTNSDVSILSFHPVKHITTGEGGAVTTNDETIYKKLIALRNNGVIKNNFGNTEMAYDKRGNKNPWYYEMVYPGLNYRITDFQCALGLSQMRKLNMFLERRRELAKRYDKAFEGNEFIKPLYKYKENSAYHLYIVQINFSKLSITKAELFNMAKSKGIGLQVHYIPVYKQPFYQKMGYGSLNLKNMEQYYVNTVSIPLYPSLKDEEQNFVIDTLLTIIEEHRL